MSIYAEVAERTINFRQANPLDLTWLDAVRLTDDVALSQMTSEEDGLFQWFLHQAKQGVAGAKSNIGGLLYYGQNGLKKNVNAAFDYFVSALRDIEDDDSLEYSIGIMQLKGEAWDVIY